MTERNDSDLRDRFRALRREDAAAAPPFDATLTAARARRVAPPRRPTGWLAAAAPPTPESVTAFTCHIHAS